MRTKAIAGVCVAGLFTSLLIAANPPDKKERGDGTITLGAADAQISGPNARLQLGGEKSIEWWTNVDTSLSWAADFPSAGKYHVALSYSIIGNNNNGGKIGILVGSQRVSAAPKGGSGWNDYKTGYAGDMTIEKAGRVTVTAKPISAHEEFVINLRSISFVPAEAPIPGVDISDSPIKQSEDGTFKLSATDARIDGMNAQLELPEGSTEKDIGFWKDRDTYLVWGIDVHKPGRYRVEMNYALTPSSEGSKVAVSAGDQTIAAKPKPGKNWKDYREGKFGEITLGESPNQKIILRALSKPVDFVINFHSLSLIPADAPSEAVDISDKPAKQGADGILKLNIEDGEIDGQTARLEGGDNKYIVWWAAADSTVRWPVKVEKPGTFKVELTYSLAPTNGNSQIVIKAGGQKVATTLKPGSGLDDFQTQNCGEMIIAKAGNTDVVISSTKEPGGLVMHLRSAALVPISR